ncbi:hypothetical protein BSKO_01669 [Bryopsis sp. KO-2023]|nr:hypothetical protein BSKO_01669 [Bryopsis sp. KO-2023]
MRCAGIQFRALPAGWGSSTRRKPPCPSGIPPLRQRRCSNVRRIDASLMSSMDDYEAIVEESRLKTMEEYMELKKLLLRRTRTASGFLAAYFGLAVSPLTGITSVIGSCGGYIYLLLLMRDVDRVSADDMVPMWEANKLPEGIPRYLAKWLASYYHAINLRLSVLVALAAGLSFYNGVFPEPLPLASQGSLLLGFLAYKVSFFQLLYDDLKPKFDPDRFTGPGKPPSLTQGLPEEKEDLDLYGRKKASVEQKIEEVTKEGGDQDKK